MAFNATPQTYRVDFEDHAGQTIVQAGLSRAEAMKLARRLSGKFGSAYAIATSDGKDTGQRVYANGAYSHQDDVF